MHDKHVVKMILESIQMLNAAHQRIDGACPVTFGYPPSVLSHPCTLWVCKSEHNYQWLWLHLIALHNEYKLRYHKTHAKAPMIVTLARPPLRIPCAYFTEPPQAMPDEYKVNGDSVAAYRAYYRGAKRTYQLKGTTRMNSWTVRGMPSWMGE